MEARFILENGEFFNYELDIKLTVPNPPNRNFFRIDDLVTKELRAFYSIEDVESLIKYARTTTNYISNLTQDRYSELIEYQNGLPHIKFQGKLYMIYGFFNRVEFGAAYLGEN